MDTQTGGDARDEDGASPSTEYAGATGHLKLRISLGSASFSGKGDSAGVLSAFSAFRDFYSDSTSTIEAEETGAEKVAGSREPDSEDTGGVPAKDAPSDSKPGDMPLSVFLAAKKLPRGNHVISLGIAVWAKRHKREEVFTPDAIKDWWKQSNKKVPSNVGRDVASAAKQGWLERLATGRNYSLTTYGETHFDSFPEADSD